MKLLGSVFFRSSFAGVSYGGEGEVTIKRDNFGVGHVYADTVYGLYHGYGYAVAQDRLFQMEMTKRSTHGKVAEVLGSRAARTKRLHCCRRDKSPHYDDQLKMYETFGKKRMWITEEDVEKNKTSEVVLNY